MCIHNIGSPINSVTNTTRDDHLVSVPTFETHKSYYKKKNELKPIFTVDNDKKSITVDICHVSFPCEVECSSLKTKSAPNTVFTTRNNNN